MRTKCCLESLRVRDHSKDPDVNGRIILKWMLRKYGERVWIRFMWLMIGTDGGLL
jgi:hypothetical protein